MRAVESQDFSVRGIQPRPTSLVYPFSIPGRQRLGENEKDRRWTPDVVGPRRASPSHSMTLVTNPG